jgi:hypothetical protein
MPRDRYPQLTAHIAEMTSGEGDDRFAFAIDTFLDGLVARSVARRAANASAGRAGRARASAR